MDKIAKFERNMTALSADERRAVEKSMGRIVSMSRERNREILAKCFADFVDGCARTRQRQASDAKTDPARRILVGARISRETAERYREAAQESHRSLYRFVVDALESEYRRTTERV